MVALIFHIIGSVTEGNYVHFHYTVKWFAYEGV